LNDNQTFCTALATRVHQHLSEELPSGRVFTPQLGLRCPKCTNPSCAEMRTFFNKRKSDYLAKNATAESEFIEDLEQNAETEEPLKETA